MNVTEVKPFTGAVMKYDSAEGSCPLGGSWSRKVAMVGRNSTADLRKRPHWGSAHSVLGRKAEFESYITLGMEWWTGLDKI